MSEKQNHRFDENAGTDCYISSTVAINLEKSRKAEVYDPYDYRGNEHPTTNAETLLHLLKGSLGTGILAMPLAFYHSGYILGVVATILIGLLCTYCVHMLLDSKYELCKRRRVPNMTYPATAECAFREGPPIFRKFATFSRHSVNFFLMIYQLGSCTVYTVFIGDNVHLVLKEYDIDIDSRWIMLIFLLPLICINYVRNLKSLAPVTFVANIFTVIGFTIIFYCMMKQDIVWEDRKAFGSYKNYPLYFGTALFALEAVGVILPLENEMKSPKAFVGLYGILNTAMMIIVVLYVGMGLFGYLAFGSAIGGSISYTIGNEILLLATRPLLIIEVVFNSSIPDYIINKPFPSVFDFYAGLAEVTIRWTKTLVGKTLYLTLAENVFSALVRPAQVCRVMLSLAIFTSHPLQMYPALDIVWMQYLQPKLEKNPQQIIYEYAVRTFLVLFSFCLAIAVPYIELFISFFGALSLSTLGLAYPALIYLSTNWNSLNGIKGTMIITRNFSIVLFGCFGLIVGVSTSLEKIFEKFTHTT